MDLSRLDEAELRRLFELRAVIDEALERALVKRASVSEAVQALLPEVLAHTGAQAIYVESYGEDLALHEFRSPKHFSLFDQVDRRAETPSEIDGTRILQQKIDVAGTWFGTAGLAIDADRNHTYPEAALAVLCEELDNFLYAIKVAREKHVVMMKLAGALRNRVLVDGLTDAARILSEAVAIERMIVVYLAEENLTSALHVQVFEHGEHKADLRAEPGFGEIEPLARRYLAGEGRDFLQKLGAARAQEEVLINGITHSIVVGKIAITCKRGDFNTYDRELLAGFAGFIRQRIVDFNKEWRTLAHSFRTDDVARLLQADDYRNAYLAPREAEVAILYADISGFTHLSEQVLKTPAKVAALVEQWGKSAVDCVWHHHGVFDKMVGDCVIALFGPPFYEDTPSERLARALACARDIRTMTQKVSARPGFEHLRDVGVGVSIGVNLAPLFVGSFGPNNNFTGFSSGMNNTARLQGCAKRDQILVMADAAQRLTPGHSFAFGEAQQATVKNVAEPLRYLALAD